MHAARTENGLPAPMPVEDIPGLRPVQPDRPDPGMFPDQAFEIVDHRRPDVRVEASFPLGRLQHIPQSDSVPAEKRPSRPEVLSDGLAMDAGKNPPEMVAGIRVVFARRQRGVARQGAQDQDAGAVVDNRFQPFFHRHFSTSIGGSSSIPDQSIDGRNGKILPRAIIRNPRRRPSGRSQTSGACNVQMPTRISSVYQP